MGKTFLFNIQIEQQKLIADNARLQGNDIIKIDKSSIINENNIIKSHFTFKGMSFGKPSLMPIYTKQQICLYQRCGILFRGQKIIENESTPLKMGYELKIQCERYKRKIEGSKDLLDGISTELDFIERKLIRKDIATFEEQQNILSIVSNFI